MNSRPVQRQVRCAWAVALMVWSVDAFSEPTQTPLPGVLDEIVVTAQKREQNAQDVGIPITVLSGDQLRKLGFTETTDIVQQVPSLQFQSTSTFATLNIRGVSQTEFTDQNELPIAVVVDGVYISSPGAVQTQMFDLDRVEVLRGPQGTLFGRNSTGGLLQFVTAKPTDSFGGYANLTYGAYNQVKFDTALSGPIAGDTLLGRISLSEDYHEGYLYNSLGPAELSARTYSGRGQLLFRPTDDLRILLKLQTSINDHEKNGGYVWDPAFPGADGLGVHIAPNQNPWNTCGGCDLLGYRNFNTNPYHQSFDTPGFFDRRANEAAVTLDWDTRLGTVTSVSDFYTHRKNYLEDTDASPNPLFIYGTDNHLNQFSEELRLSSTKGDLFWVTGLYFLDINNHFIQTLTFNFGPGASFFGSDDRLDTTKSWAAFGQLEYPLATHWKLVAGGRWTNDEKELDGSTLNPFGNGIREIVNSSTIGDAAKQNFRDWQGKLQLEWRPDPGSLWYAGISRGTKAGGFEGNLIDPTHLVYGEEKLTDYEAGFKLTFAKAATRLNGTVFYYDYKDYQAFQFDQETLSSSVRNTPARVRGAELEVRTRPLRSLEVSLGLSLLDAVAKGIVLPSGRIADRKMPQAPDASLNGLLRYTVPVSTGDVSFQYDFKYNRSFYFTVNNAPVEREDPHLLGNVRVAYDSSDERWDIGVFVKNVSNVYYRVYALDVSGLGFSNDRPGLPRWWGINGSYHFGAR